MKFALPNVMTNTRFLIALSLLALTGCASNTPTLCDSNSWHERGYSHAMKGSDEQSSKAKTDCSTEDAPLAYRMGFDYGLQKYCTFKRGLWAGEMGKGAAESCAQPKWDEYQTGYLTGHKIFAVNSDLESISHELETVRSQLWELESAGETQNSAPVQDKLARIEQLKQQRYQASRHLMNLKVDTRTP